MSVQSRLSGLQGIAALMVCLSCSAAATAFADTAVKVHGYVLNGNGEGLSKVDVRSFVEVNGGRVFIDPYKQTGEKTDETGHYELNFAYKRQFHIQYWMKDPQTNKQLYDAVLGLGIQKDKTAVVHEIH